MPFSKLRFIPLTLLMLLVLLASCGDQGTVVITVNGPPTTPAVLSTTPSGSTIGGPRKHQGYVLTVTAFETSDKSSKGEEADLGFVFVELNVTLGSELNQGFRFERRELSLLDAQGTSYSLTDGSKKPQLDTSYYDIPNGHSVSGWVEFEVHANVTELSLVDVSPDFLKVPLKLVLPANSLGSPTPVGSPLQFEPFVSPDGLFTISMPSPATPQLSRQNISLAGQNLVLERFMTNLSPQKILCMVGYVTPDKTSYLNLNEIRNYLEANGFGYRLSSVPITAGQLQGVEDEYLYGGSDSKAFYGKARFLTTKDRVYFFSISYSRNTQLMVDMQTFLNSFKLSTNSGN